MKFYKFLFVGALALSLAACNTSENTTTEEKSAATEQTKQSTIEITDVLGNKHTFEEPPKSVATLNLGDLDILIELGANVVGRPTTSEELLKEVADVQELGNPHEPSFEQIAAVNAEVLIVPPSFKQFESNISGTKVIYSDANSVEQIQQSIEMLGKLFAKEEEAKKLNDTITTKVNELSKNATNANALLVYGAPGTYLVALDNSLVGDILVKAGGKNIASDFPATEKYPSYANLSIEKIVERNPEIVMLVTHGNPQEVKEGFKKQMSENAAWKNLDAVKNNKVEILPADLFGNNPGTKIVDALDYMNEKLSSLKK